MVIDAFIPKCQETEMCGSLSLRPPWLMEQVSGKIKFSCSRKPSKIERWWWCNRIMGPYSIPSKSQNLAAFDMRFYFRVKNQKRDYVISLRGQEKPLRWVMYQVYLHRVLERLWYEAVNMKTYLPWRNQNVGDSRAMGYILRKAPNRELREKIFSLNLRERIVLQSTSWQELEMWRTL